MNSKTALFDGKDGMRVPCTILSYTILYYILSYTILFYTILYYTILPCIILYYTIPYHIILYYRHHYGMPLDTSETASLSRGTVGFHNFNLRIFNLRVSNPSKLIVDDLLTRCRISMCQGLGPKKHDEISEIDRMRMRVRTMSA